MSNNFKKIAGKSLQPKEFSFSKENQNIVSKILKTYPKNYPESSIMPLLDLVQEQNNGWIPKKAIEFISELLKVSEIKVLEIATFYSMYNLCPVGKNHVEVCTTTPCMLRGSEKILEKCKTFLNLNVGDVTDDNKFSLIEVECLGACVNAPVIKIGESYYEDLDDESIEKILCNLKDGKKIADGSQINRKGSEPVK
tara:strand:+ start:3840 stop:4427 length:588 start_codon:yes stop_codon:yes gene_type:complete